MCGLFFALPLYPGSYTGRSDNDVKNRWNLVCRRERAAEKNLQRANSGGSASSTSTAASCAVAAAIAGAPPRHGRTLSSGTVETAAAAALLGDLPDGADRNCSRGGSRSLPVSRATSSEEQQSMIEAREAAEAGAGLVKVRVLWVVFFFFEVLVSEWQGRKRPREKWLGSACVVVDVCSCVFGMCCVKGA